MPRNVTTLDILLVSPTDVASERSLVVDRISNWNLRNGVRLGVNFNILRWEEIPAGFGAEPQDVVNQRIGSDYDAIIAIFWNRVGTATKNFASGSVEEYERALERFKAGEKVEISFYFKTTPINPNNIDIEQIALLRDLKSKIGPDGGLYKEFDTNDKFSNEIDLLLDSLASRLGPVVSRISAIPTLNPTVGKGVRVENVKDVSVELEGRGLIDINEDISERIEEITAFAQEISKNMEDLGARVAQSKDGMNAAKDISGEIILKQAKPIISQLSKYMDEFSEFSEITTPKLIEVSVLFTNDLRELVDVSKDFDHSDEQILAAVSSSISLQDSMTGVADQLEEFQRNVETLQRMSREFNIAKRRLSSTIQSMADGMRNSASLLQPSIRELEALLSQS